MVAILPMISSSQYFFRVFGDCSKGTNYNWNHHHFHDSQPFQFSGKIQVFVNLFAFLFSFNDQLERLYLLSEKYFPIV